VKDNVLGGSKNTQSDMSLRNRTHCDRHLWPRTTRSLADLKDIEAHAYSCAFLPLTCASSVVDCRFSSPACSAIGRLTVYLCTMHG